MGLQLRKKSRRSFASRVLMLATVSFLALPSCAGSRRPPKEPECPPDAAIGPDGSCWAMLATTGCESCSNQSDGTSVPTQSTASASETTTTVAGTRSNRYLVSAPPVVSDPHHPGGKTVDGSGTSLHHRWSFTNEDARNSGA